MKGLKVKGISVARHEFPHCGVVKWNTREPHKLKAQVRFLPPHLINY